MHRIITKLDGLVDTTPGIIGIAMHAMADATTTSNDVVTDIAVMADEPANLSVDHVNHDRAIAGNTQRRRWQDISFPAPIIFVIIKLPKNGLQALLPPTGNIAKKRLCISAAKDANPAVVPSPPSTLQQSTTNRRSALPMHFSPGHEIRFSPRKPAALSPTGYR
jgi:hypothetical protein